MSEEKDAAITEAERQFAGVFVRSRRATRERAAAVHPDLTVLGYHVLSVLVRTGQQAQSTLVEQLSTDKAMISRTVGHLSELGFLERATDPCDRRVQLLTLSAAERAERACPLCGAPMTPHVIDRSGPKPLMHCP